MKRNKRYAAFLVIAMMLVGVMMPTKSTQAEGWNLSATENKEGTYDQGAGGEYSITVWAKVDDFESVSADDETVDEKNYKVEGKTYEDEDEEGAGVLEEEEEVPSYSAPSPAPSTPPTTSTGGLDDAAPKETEVGMAVRELELVGATHYYTKITFFEDYMKSLSAGEHEISIRFSKGTCKAIVNVIGTETANAATADAAGTTGTAPKTGDSSFAVRWIALAAVSGGAVIYIASKRKKA